MKIPPGSFDSDCRIVITKNGQERHVTLDELLAVFLAADNVFDGAVTFNSIPSLAGGAIRFPATQVPSANANDLDDYEENTFTPAISGTSSAGAGTYSTQVGRYTKIGDIVFFVIDLVWSAHTGTGNILITGLPFTSAATTARGPISIRVTNMTFSGGALQGRVASSNTEIIMETVASGGGAAALPMDTSASLAVSGFYFV